MRSKLIALLLGLVSQCAFAQFTQTPDSTNHHEVRIGVNALVSATDELPFWLTANQSGRYTGNRSLSSVFTLQAFNHPPSKIFNLYYGIEGQVEVGESVTTGLIQAYGGINLGLFNLRAGMKEEFLGIGDSTLSVGNLVYGNNARPIPKIVLETPGWVRAPILGNVFSFKAYIAHGWFERERYQSAAMLHQKYVYVRTTALKGKLNLISGIHHNAQWGGSNSDQETKQPTALKDFARIFFGQPGGNDAANTDQQNALGNHLGSFDFNLSYDFGSFTVSNYWQFLWEDKSGLTPFNWRDGLIGLSVKANDSNGFITGFNAEIVRTSHQDAFKNDDGVEFIEPDNFLNNSVYRSGWTYQERVIGNAMFFLLNPQSISSQKVKNMINGINLGIEGEINAIQYRLNYMSFKNHGTIQERINNALRLKLVSLDLSYSKGPNYFGFQSSVEWGNYPGKNAGFVFTYARAISF